jgi:exopolyphosphatase/guanosine-5'-triphosphate,3'-diphosphate pyrophosphatase
MPWPEIEHILEMLQELTPTERLAVPGLNAGRADIIVAGLAVAAEVCERIEPRDFVASAYGIREGLLLDVARITPVVSDPGEARERSVREFAERCHYEEPHARQVQRLALQLFDAIGARLGCSPADRVVLSDAALLHDVGYHINYQKHHKHSFHLIQHADFLGMTPDEQTVVAHVARYHRGSPPDRDKHEAFGRLDRATRERIERLSAILRVADGFDRGHAAAVDKLRVRWMRRAMRITAHANPRAATMRLELWGANRKKELLEEMAGAPVEIVAPDGTVVGDTQE